MSQFFELHYHLPEDPARLFDVAQGLAGRRNILKRGGTVKVKPFTETCRRLLFQCIAFAVLTALTAVLVWALHAKLKVLFFLCLVMSLVTFWTYQAGRMGYRKSWTQSGRATVPTAPSPSPPPVSGSGTPPTTRSGSLGSSGTAASSAGRSSY